VFSRKEFHRATIGEIPKEADVAKVTLYYNFSGKSRLFAATAIEE